MRKKVKGIMIVAVVAIFGMTTLAFAGWGRGRGRMMGSDDWRPGWNQRGGYGNCPGWNSGNLSEEEMDRLDQQRSEFFKSTENIRQKLYEKRLALRNELAKEKPDIKNASKLQKDISKLQSDLDQKRLDYELKLRKSVPGYNKDYRGYGPRMGYGPRGRGYCVR